MNESLSLIQERLKEDEFKRSQLIVTERDYQEAVNLLVKVANTDTSNAMVAAQVLLSLYNGYNWHVDLCDLGYLDYDNLQAALICIRGRILLSIEPHEVIDNGKQIFSELENEWQHLHVRNRYAKIYE